MLYAAYGSNLHPERLKARVQSARLLGTGNLDGWSLYFHKRGKDGSGKCNIAPGRDSVHFAVYDVDTFDMLILDRIEGVGLGYTREVVMIPGFGHCATYLGSEDYLDDQLKPYCWYRELVLVGAREHEFDPNYVAMLERVESHTDPDPGRHAEHWALIKSFDPATTP